MIGVSLAMPYLLGAFGGTAGGLWTNFGALSQTGAASTNPFLKVFGYAGKGVYNTANFVGGTTRGITQTISKTFAGFSKGGNLSEGFSNFFKGTSEVVSGKAGLGTGKFLNVGGVSLGNENIMRKLYHDSVNRTMELSGVFKSMTPDFRTYHRTVVNNAGLDSKSGLDYVLNNGGYSTQKGPEVKYFLDKSLSKDFTLTQPVSPHTSEAIRNYNWTGTNMGKTIKAMEKQTGYNWKPKLEGDMFEQPQGILSKGIGGKELIASAKKHLFGNDSQKEIVPYATGSMDELNKVTGNYDATQAFKAVGGMTSEEYQRWQEQLNMNISGSR